ncbi:hypothetical protein EYF80_004845 [Liparis tanakae]|uniref:Uncharacterized protein n=1 Tax=Liparis tanakae TaxID=230148 RepID=A0A4Z2J3M3_9TELE|nr:hypothetical protein EYF80_004845 [Liparis tanakae]
MAHAASQLKKRADENLNAVEDEKEKKKAARKRSRELKKKVEEEEGRKGKIREGKKVMEKRELTQGDFLFAPLRDAYRQNDMPRLNGSLRLPGALPAAASISCEISCELTSRKSHIWFESQKLTTLK